MCATAIQSHILSPKSALVSHCPTATALTFGIVAGRMPCALASCQRGSLNNPRADHMWVAVASTTSGMFPHSGAR